MLELLYIPKYKGEKQLFKIGQVVSLVFEELCNRTLKFPFGIIMSPGYLSTTQNTIHEYVNKFLKVVNHQNKFRQMYAGLFVGMNGGINVNKQSNTILDQHLCEFKSKQINQLMFKSKPKNKDHRKMIFFFVFKSDPKVFLPSTITKTDIHSFTENISVEYMLVGSSNQSNNTYYSSTASHGEADILFFNNSDFEEMVKKEDLLIHDDNYLSGCVLSKVHEERSSLHPNFRFDSMNYLNAVLRDFLINNLL
ncbi:MAG: hypothetical protein IJ078_00200 [Succinivibrionaceae bacterium]|nr:hypothetical protein [Succinivibrionaceae bacterium]